MFKKANPDQLRNLRGQLLSFRIATGTPAAKKLPTRFALPSGRVDETAKDSLA